MHLIFADERLQSCVVGHSHNYVNDVGLMRKWMPPLPRRLETIYAEIAVRIRIANTESRNPLRDRAEVSCLLPSVCMNTLRIL